MPAIEVPSGTITRDPIGAGTVSTTATEPGVPRVRIDPVQIVGLVPMYSCNATECRENPLERCCDRLPVFGGDDYAESNIGSYENDVNSFLVDVSLYTANSGSTVATWYLQKCTGANTWTSVTTIVNDNTYGYVWVLGSNTLNPNYTGLRLNWGKVYALHGRGIYRIKLTTSTRTIVGCLQSAEFNLRPFDCEDAHGTFKFETMSIGQIGAYGRKGKFFNLCGFSPLIGDPKINSGWYDSIRLPGFFGKEVISDYIEVYNEWQNGKMEQVKNEAKQAYELSIYPIEKDLHDRMKIYGLMADVRQMSDYNINNSDYNIRQVSVKPTGPYEPKYNDKLWYNKQSVKVKFENGYQHLIKSICCPTIR